MDTAICLGDTLTMNLPVSSGTVSWTQPSKTLNESGTLVQFFPTAAATTYIATLTSPYGCVNRDTFVLNTLTVDFSLISDHSICAGSSTNLTVITDDPSSTYTYAWSPSTDLDLSDSANPVATPKETMTYRVTATSDKGCKNSAEVTVTVVTVDTLKINSVSLPEIVVLCENALPATISFQGSATGTGSITDIDYLWTSCCLEFAEAESARAVFLHRI